MMADRDTTCASVSETSSPRSAMQATAANAPVPTTRGVTSGHTVQNSAGCMFLDRLPVELRLQIYEYVLGGDLIHIALFDNDSGIVDDESKIITVVCSTPNAESNAYRLSKDYDPGDVPADVLERARESDIDNFDFPEIIDHPEYLGPYHERHEECSRIQQSFRQDCYVVPYNISITHYRDCDEDRDLCRCPERHELARYKTLTESLGLPREGGLDRLYPHAKYNLDLLKVCKQVYREARLIPFYANRFHFDSEESIQIFAKYLDPRQKAAVQKIQIYAGEVEEVEEVMWLLNGAAKAFGSMKTLQMTFATLVTGYRSSNNGMIREFRSCDSTSRPFVADANIIVGRDDYSGINTGAKRQRRRQQASIIEKYYATAEPISDSEWAFLKERRRQSLP